MDLNQHVQLVYQLAIKMKQIITLAIVVIALSATLLNANAADASFCQPNIAPSLWQRFSEGIAIAVTLARRTDAFQAKRNSLEIYIQNISSVPFGYNPNAGVFGIKVFYIDNQKDIPLRPFRELNDPLSDWTLRPGRIKAGQTMRIRIDLTDRELLLVKSNPIKCTLPVYDSSLEKAIDLITTSPRLLEEQSSEP